MKKLHHTFNEMNVPVPISFGEVQWLSVPADIGGGLEMTGTDDGHFTLEVREKQGNKLKKQVNFSRVDTKKGMKVTLPFPKKEKMETRGKQNTLNDIDAEIVADDLELIVDKHDGKIEKVQTGEMKQRRKGVEEDQSSTEQIVLTSTEEALVSDTATSTLKVIDESVSTSTPLGIIDVATTTEAEFILKNDVDQAVFDEMNGQGTSTVPTSSKLPHTLLFLASTLPIIRSNSGIGGLKRKTTRLLFAFSTPFLILALFQFVFGIDLFKTLGVWQYVKNYDDQLLLILISPLIIFTMSLLFHLASESVYKKWLWWTGTSLVLLVLFIVMTAGHRSAMNIGPDGSLVLLVLYVIGSGILLLGALIGGPTRKTPL